MINSLIQNEIKYIPNTQIIINRINKVISENYSDFIIYFILFNFNLNLFIIFLKNSKNTKEFYYLLDKKYIEQ